MVELKLDKIMESEFAKGRVDVACIPGCRHGIRTYNLLIPGIDPESSSDSTASLTAVRQIMENKGYNSSRIYCARNNDLIFRLSQTGEISGIVLFGANQLISSSLTDGGVETRSSLLDHVRSDLIYRKITIPPTLLQTGILPDGGFNDFLDRYLPLN